MRLAMTLIEMIFVIIVIGIIASIGSDIIFKLYENKLIASAVDQASTKTHVTLEIIAHRLSYRIPDTEISIDPATNSKIPLTSTTANKVLEWIGYCYEGMRGEYNSSKGFSQPGWSGLVDIDNPNTDKTKIITPGSQLSIARDIILALSNNTIDLNNPNNKSAIIFRGALPSGTDPVSAYYTDPYPGVFTVYRTNDKTLNFDDTSSKTVYEHYYLTWTAYAIVPEENGPDDYNLSLYYDFRPWDGDEYSDGKKSLLAAHISKFKFRKVDKSIELILCGMKKISEEYNVTFCGKKVVF